MFVLEFIRSIIFTILFWINTLYLVILTFIARIFVNDNFIKKVAKNWAKINILLLKYICNVKYEVEGAENIPEDKVFLVVSKHQSTWETYFLFQYFKDYLIFVVKKELLAMPGVGTALKCVGCIPINRKDGIHALKKMNDKAKKMIRDEKRSILIFPQGTRVPLNASAKEYPYKGGFISIAKENELDMLPIALNSAKCWPRKGFIKKAGTIKVKIMPIIKYSDYSKLNKNDIVKLVESTIEENQKTLD